jgi:hypothetical protein
VRSLILALTKSFSNALSNSVIFTNESLVLISSKGYLSISLANASSIKEGDATERFEKSMIIVVLSHLEWVNCHPELVEG